MFRLINPFSGTYISAGEPDCSSMADAAKAAKAKKIIEIHSHYFPHSVFINERNLIDIPILTIYHKKVKKQDFLFLSGDVQPIDEPACYDFCETIIDFVKKSGCKEVVTLGGIGLQKIPKKPKVYITGTDKNMLKRSKKQIIKFMGLLALSLV